MKAIGMSSDLASALSEAQSFTDRKHNIAAARNVLLTAEDGFLHISGTNLATGFTTHVEAQIGEGGSLVVPGEISDILKTCDGSVNLSITDGKLNIKAEGFKGSFNGISGENFPIFPSPDGVMKDAVVSSESLESALTLTAFAVGDEDDIVTGNVLFRFKPKEKKLTLAATDGFRFSIATIDLVKTTLDKESEILIPGRSVESLHRPLRAHKSDQNTEINIGLDNDKKMLVYSEEFRWFSCSAEGRYPDLSPLLPKQATCMAKVDAADLLRSTRRLQALAKITKSEKGGSLKIHFDPDASQIFMDYEQDEVGAGATSMKALFGNESKEIETYLSLQFLFDCVSSLQSQGATSCQLALDDDIKTPFTITGEIPGGPSNLMGIARMNKPKK